MDLINKLNNNCFQIQDSNKKIFNKINFPNKVYHNFHKVIKDKHKILIDFLQYQKDNNCPNKVHKHQMFKHKPNLHNSNNKLNFNFHKL